jgi:hypothetical protein
VEGFLNMAPAQPANPNANVTCRVSRLVPQREELKPDALGVLRVKRGATLEVLLECKLTEPVTCAIVSFPRPCGVELIQAPKLEKGIVAVEEHDDALHFFADYWETGKHEVRMLVRAEAPGIVFAPIPQLWSMYGKTLSVAVSAPQAWQVEP